MIEKENAFPLGASAPPLPPTHTKKKERKEKKRKIKKKKGIGEGYYK